MSTVGRDEKYLYFGLESRYSDLESVINKVHQLHGRDNSESHQQHFTLEIECMPGISDRAVKLITRRRRFGGASASPGSPAGHCNCIDFDNSSVVLLHCKPIVLISQAVLSCLTLLLTRPLIPD